MRLARFLAVAVIASALPLGCLTTPFSRGIARSLERGPNEFLAKAVVGPQGDGTYVVATTQVVNPAGETVQFPGRPTDLALSPDGALLAVKASGRSYTEGLGDIVLIDTATREVRQMLEFPSGGNTFCGLAWSSDGPTLWTTDSDGTLHGAKVQGDGTFAWAHAIQLPGPKGRGNSAPGGLSLDESNGLAYVTLSRNNTLGVIDLEKQSVIDEIPVGIAPYTVVRRRGKAYVSNWGGRRPAKGDVTGPTSGSRAVVDPETGIASTGTVSVVDLGLRKTVVEIPVGLHPSGMVFSPDRPS